MRMRTTRIAVHYKQKSLISVESPDHVHRTKANRVAFGPNSVDAGVVDSDAPRPSGTALIRRV